MTALPAKSRAKGRQSDGSRIAAEAAVEGAMCDVLTALGVPSGPHTAGTPGRVARMMVREVFAGLFEPPPALTSFPNEQALDQLYAVGPIAVRSCCAHHLVPIIGQAWIGVLPGESLIGLSKFHRLTAWIMARPQTQEEATQQLADALCDAIKPIGLAVIVRARHFCTAWRGVRDEPSLMTTSVMRGALLTAPAARAEFMSLVSGMGYR